MKVTLGIYFACILLLAIQGFLVAHRVDHFVRFWNGVLARLQRTTRLVESDFQDPSFRTFGDTAVLFAFVMAALPFFAFYK